MFKELIKNRIRYNLYHLIVYIPYNNTDDNYHLIINKDDNIIYYYFNESNSNILNNDDNFILNNFINKYKNELVKLYNSEKPYNIIQQFDEPFQDYYTYIDYCLSNKYLKTGDIFNIKNFKYKDINKENLNDLENYLCEFNDIISYRTYCNKKGLVNSEKITYDEMVNMDIITFGSYSILKFNNININFTKPYVKIIRNEHIISIYIINDKLEIIGNNNYFSDIILDIKEYILNNIETLIYNKL